MSSTREKLAHRIAKDLSCHDPMLRLPRCYFESKDRMRAPNGGSLVPFDYYCFGMLSLQHFDCRSRFAMRFKPTSRHLSDSHC